MKQIFHINPEYSEFLAKIGLNSLETFFSYSKGECLSEHRRGATYRIRLENGEILYLKRDNFTFLRDIFSDVIHFRKPHPKATKERLAFEAARLAGFIAPEVIAYGEESCCGVPKRGVYIMKHLPGKSLQEHILNDMDEAQVNALIQQGESIVRALQQKGLDWPDNKPEHFIVMPDGKIAIIDLERLLVKKPPLSSRLCDKQLRKFNNLSKSLKEKRSVPFSNNP